MIDTSEAIKIIVSKAKNLSEQTILLNKSLGRVTSKNIYAKLNNPPENVSSMDGYAIKFTSLKYISNTPIKVIGESSAGKPYKKKIKDFECIQIFTGAEVPKETNIILLQENVLIKNNTLTSTTQNPLKGQYIRKKGSNFTKNSIIIKKNELLTSRKIGLAISANNTNVKVYRRPKVAILATGNELKKPGQNIKSGIISSNTLLLISIINSLGAISTDLGSAKDTIKSLKSKLRDINDYDILITTGGASVGKHDLVKDVLIHLGMKLIFWKVAMRPGKPLIFGKLNKTLILGFPGNPVSAFVSSIIFAKPLIFKLLKLNYKDEVKKGIITKNLSKNDKRQEYLRAKISYKNNTYIANPLSAQDSSMSLVLSKANGLIVRKSYAPKSKKGDTVSIILFSDLHSNI